MNLVIQVYLEDFQKIKTPSIVKINPLKDFEFLVSDIQLTSSYLLS
jgi:hypothetical protein